VGRWPAFGSARPNALRRSENRRLLRREKSNTVDSDQSKTVSGHSVCDPRPAAGPRAGRNPTEPAESATPHRTATTESWRRTGRPRRPGRLVFAKIRYELHKFIFIMNTDTTRKQHSRENNTIHNTIQAGPRMKHMPRRGVLRTWLRNSHVKRESTHSRTNHRAARTY
jgi:hypothetical protein